MKNMRFLPYNISPLNEGVGNYKEKNSKASYLFSQRTLLWLGKEKQLEAFSKIANKSYICQQWE